ncbi:MAG: 2-amino-4-hydroxy-6-hydroxymethyldihydropteridine diphosphokinase [Planctomycetota bacterium]
MPEPAPPADDENAHGAVAAAAAEADRVFDATEHDVADDAHEHATRTAADEATPADGTDDPQLGEIEDADGHDENVADTPPDDDDPQSPDRASGNAIERFLALKDQQAVSTWIGLGGNTGPTAETFDWALSELACRAGELVAVSDFFKTAAVGPASGDFVNAVVEISTDLHPDKLLALLKELEDAVGRTHSDRWASRPLDLDIIAFGDVHADTPQLTLPHAGCHYRRFVLDPLCQIAPLAVHAGCGLTYGDLRARLLTRPLTVTVVGDATDASGRADWLGEEADARIEFVPWDDAFTAADADRRPALILRPAGRPGPADAVDLTHVPGTPAEAVRAVLRAATDEPRPL